MSETNTTKLIQLEYYEEYITQPGMGTCYYLSSETENNVFILDKDGKPFPKQENRIGFV